ncbi:hypothetical protein H0H92_004565 [Tricholoma furcatifolium]|nr:hypothetical protein H0H92_004565 [Tricholoma furcatifolium]
MTYLSDAQVYARQLLPKRHGYPLWVPEPYGNSVVYRTKGVRIGDVGYVTEDGGFESLFNVRASPSDPINHRGVPEGFEQVDIPVEDIVHIPNFHQPGGVVTSDNTKKRSIDVDISSPEIPGVSPGAGGGLQFTWASSEGAILHLPTGACRLTCPPELFRDVAFRGAKNWYRFANDTLRRCVPNGSLYLITGCDKTTSWMVGAFSDKSSDSQASFNLSVAGCEARVAYSYSWDTSCPAVFRTGTSIRSIDSLEALRQNGAIIAQDDAVFAADAPNSATHCAFIRGYRIMLRTNPMTRMFGGAGKVEIGSISSLSSKDIAQATTDLRYTNQSLHTPRFSVRDNQRNCDALGDPENESVFSTSDSPDVEAFLEYLPETTEVRKRLSFIP